MNVKVLLCGCALVMATTAYVCASDDVVGGNGMKRGGTAMFFSDGDALGVPDGALPLTTTFPTALDVLELLAKDCAQARQDVELSQARLNSILYSGLDIISKILAAHSMSSTTSLTQEEQSQLQDSYEDALNLIDQARGSTQELLNALGRWKDSLVEVVGAHPASKDYVMSTPNSPIPLATMSDTPEKTPKPSVSNDSE